VKKARKKKLTLWVPEDLINQAKKFGLNLSQIMTAQLEAEIAELLNDEIELASRRAGNDGYPLGNNIKKEVRS